MDAWADGARASERVCRAAAAHVGMRSRADSTVGGDKVRILVLGDSGVGKTSLVHLICQGEELKKPRSTVGCAINMTVHEPRGNPGSSCFVEFWYGPRRSAGATARLVRLSAPGSGPVGDACWLRAQGRRGITTL